MMAAAAGPKVRDDGFSKAFEAILCRDRVSALACLTLCFVAACAWAAPARAVSYSQNTLPFTGLSSTLGVAVDSSGDVFVADEHRALTATAAPAAESTAPAPRDGGESDGDAAGLHPGGDPSSPPAIELATRPTGGARA
jgi:hypothetical protein